MKAKKCMVGLALMSLMMIMIPSIVNAATVPYDRYELSVPAWQRNARFSQSQYWSSGNKYNQWSVDLDYSTEGEGTYMTFWLEDGELFNLTSGHNVMVGDRSSFNYQLDDGTVSYYNLKTYLTCQNNNYNSGVYYIEGRWRAQTTN